MIWPLKIIFRMTAFTLRILAVAFTFLSIILLKPCEACLKKSLLLNRMRPREMPGFLDRLAVRSVERDLRELARIRGEKQVMQATLRKLLDELRTDRPTAPPSSFLIDLLLPPDKAEDAALTLEDAYAGRWTQKYGANKAKLVFYTQVCGLIAGHYWSRLEKLAVAWVMSSQ